MLNIRLNTFETNSSSVHTLVLCERDFWDIKLNKLNDLTEIKYGNPLIIKGQDFGRYPEPIKFSVKDKVDYLWTAIINIYYNYDYTNKKIICLDEEKVEWWKKHILKWLPKNSKLIVPNYIYEFPWIDHVYELKNFVKELEKEPAYIGCLLFDDNSFIDVGGDEYPNFAYAFLPREQSKIIHMPGGYSFYIKGN